MSSIINDLKSRILVLDGAMGTVIQTYNLEEEDFRGKKLVALAGIGNPQRFFVDLERHGLKVQQVVFADHHC